MDGFEREQRPDQQGAEHVGEGFTIPTAFAAESLGQQSGQAVAAHALGQFGVGKGAGILERVGEGGIGTRAGGGAAAVGWGGGGCSVWAMMFSTCQ